METISLILHVTAAATLVGPQLLLFVAVPRVAVVCVHPRVDFTD